MKKLFILLLLLNINMPVHAILPLNCFEYQYGAGKVNHKKYYNEPFIEPYKWGNYENKPLKQWYSDGVKANRKQNRRDFERYGLIQFNMNGMQGIYFW